MTFRRAEPDLPAGTNLVAANRFYIACGFEQRAEIIQHGHRLNASVRDVGPDSESPSDEAKLVIRLQKRS